MPNVRPLDRKKYPNVQEETNEKYEQRGTDMRNL
jgi:hypothetical protein